MHAHGSFGVALRRIGALDGAVASKDMQKKSLHPEAASKPLGGRQLHCVRRSLRVSAGCARDDRSVRPPNTPRAA